MKDSTSKEKKFYTQGQQLAARVLLIAGLLASYSPRNVLAAPDSQLSMAPGASLVEGNLSFQARAGENVRFYYQKGQWRAEVSSHIGDFFSPSRAACCVQFWRRCRKYSRSSQ